MADNDAGVFFGTPLVSTPGCVCATTPDALQHGFVPFVVREARGDRHAGPHDAKLFDPQAKYAEVVDEAEAIRRIRCR